MTFFSGTGGGSRILLGVVAASVAAAAYVQVRSRQAEREHPPTGKFVTVEGVRLHYVERGEGEPLVLLHGNTTMSMDFLLGPFIEMAARKYRVIVFDRPGYGWSERPRGKMVYGPQTQARLIHEALVKIGVERPIVHGHSWGAMVAMAMGLNHPEHVRALVLESGYWYPTARPDVPMASAPAMPVIGDIMRYTFSPLLFRAQWAAMVKIMFAPREVPDYFWRFPPWMAFRPSQHRAATAEIAQVAPAAAMLSRRYAELSVPAVILSGREDRLVWTTSHSDRLAQELPNVPYRVFEGQGHMLHHLVPEDVMAAVDDVAARSSAPSPKTERGPAMRAV
jgi:pimeloyl-ACP methyl ester carboxylesterase